MGNYLVTLRYYLPKYATVLIEAEDPDEASGKAYDMADAGHVVWQTSDDPSETYIAALRRVTPDLPVTYHTRVHLTHCNLGDYVGVCKYGEGETCPALSEIGFGDYEP